MTRRSIARWVTGVLVIASFTGTACAQIKIGVLMPLSGKGAAYGQHQQVALQMALEDIAKAGGIKGEKVEALAFDTRGDNTEAINLTRKLAYNDKVLAIVGPFFSAEVEVAFPIALAARVPIITASAAKPGIAAKARPYGFRNALASDQMDGQLVDAWLKEHPKVKSVVILTDVKDALTKADGTFVFPAALKARDIKILDNISFQTGDIDYAAQVTRAKDLRPDGIVVAANYNEGGNVLREIRKQGLTQPVLGALGMSEPKFIEIAGPAAEGVMGVMPFWPGRPDPRTAAFVKEFTKRAKISQPNNTDALMYDTLFLLKHCIEKSGVTNKPADLAADRDRIRGCIDNVEAFPGVVGPITFDKQGDAMLKPQVMRVDKGAWNALR
ncbi:MAG TPA: ABC transporter substrate-binding protein [Burkholderiales bacterium]|nr:ABC transporter substrate-binding protein [Burkholderiales bacterium]